MNELWQQLLENSFLLFGLKVIIQITLVAGIALLVIRWLGPRKPSARHAVGMCALTVILLSPALNLVLDRVNPGWVSIPVPSEQPMATVDPEFVPPQPMAQALPVPVAEETRSSEAPILHPAPAKQVELQDTGGPTKNLSMLLWVWLVGAGFMLLRLAYGFGFQYACCRQGDPVDWVNFPLVVEKLRKAGLHETALPEVVQSALVDRPLVVGLFHSRILMPTTVLQTLDQDQLSDVFVHECSHIVRHDLWMGFLQRLMAVVFWPHPLLHALNRTVARAREEICDNYVLKISGPHRYAQTLLNMSAGEHLPTSMPATAGLMGADWKLEERIRGLLDTGRDRKTAINRWVMIPMFALLAAGNVGVSALNVEATTETTEPLSIPAAELIGTGITKSAFHVFYWFSHLDPAGRKGAVVSSGTPTEHDKYRTYYFAPRVEGKEIIAVAIGAGDHVYYWYSDGTVSAGTTKHLTEFRDYFRPQVTVNKQIRAVAIAGSSGHVFYWYTDGTVSAGTADNPVKFRDFSRFNAPAGKTLIAASITRKDQVFYWWSDGTFSSGTSRHPTTYQRYTPASLAGAADLSAQPDKTEKVVGPSEPAEGHPIRPGKETGTVLSKNVPVTGGVNARHEALQSSEPHTKTVFSANFEAGSVKPEVGRLRFQNNPVRILNTTPVADPILDKSVLLVDRRTNQVNGLSFAWDLLEPVDLQHGVSISFDFAARRIFGGPKTTFLTGWDSEGLPVFRLVLGDHSAFGNGEKDRQRPGYATVDGAFTLPGPGTPGIYWWGSDRTDDGVFDVSKDGHFALIVSSNGWDLFTRGQTGATYTTTGLPTYDKKAHADLAMITITNPGGTEFGAYWDNLLVEGNPTHGPRRSAYRPQAGQAGDAKKGTMPSGEDHRMAEHDSKKVTSPTVPSKNVADSPVEKRLQKTAIASVNLKDVPLVDGVKLLYEHLQSQEAYKDIKFILKGGSDIRVNITLRRVSAYDLLKMLCDLSGASYTVDGRIIKITAPMAEHGTFSPFD